MKKPSDMPHSSAALVTPLVAPPSSGGGITSGATSGRRVTISECDYLTHTASSQRAARMSKSRLSRSLAVDDDAGQQYK